MSKLFALSLLYLTSLSLVSGCGPNNEVTVPGVDDSLLHSEEEMADMEAQYKADAGSK